MVFKSSRSTNSDNKKERERNDNPYIAGQAGAQLPECNTLVTYKTQAKNEVR